MRLLQQHMAGGTRFLIGALAVVPEGLPAGVRSATFDHRVISAGTHDWPVSASVSAVPRTTVAAASSASTALMTRCPLA